MLSTCQSFGHANNRYNSSSKYHIMTAHILYKMELFSRHSNSSSNHTCPDKSLADPRKPFPSLNRTTVLTPFQAQEPFVGSFSFHQVALMASGACTVISCLLCCLLIFRHATHYAVPKEQKQYALSPCGIFKANSKTRIIRMVFIVPVFAVCAFLSVAFLRTSIYIQPVDTLYESFALSAFFLYLLCCIQEGDDERQSFFASSGQMAGYRVCAPPTFPVSHLTVFRKQLSWSSSSQSWNSSSSSLPKSPKRQEPTAQPRLSFTLPVSGYQSSQASQLA